MTIIAEAHTPNPIDVHVGERVRLRRKMLGVSQDQLAGALGLTFQQVQKYERGTNRISASKLYMIARALDVPVSFFFDGLDDAADGADHQSGQDPERAVVAFLGTPEGRELAQTFPQVRRGPLRRQVLDLVRMMAESESESADPTSSATAEQHRRPGARRLPRAGASEPAAT